ncbi:MAG: hypothetical protein M3071_22530 [Actinomycetota bacterium]|nr:hypothetical protein [Actinomycetota bacterium]
MRRSRALARRWAVAAQENRLPRRVVDPEGPNHVLVYGRYGAGYRFDGFTCRWMNLPPHKTAYLPGRGSCSSHAEPVTWSYRGVLSPSVGTVTGCGRWVNVEARRRQRTARPRDRLRERGANGAVRPQPWRRPPRHGVFQVVRRVVRGFRFIHSGSAFHARKGHAEIAFSLCWYNVDC